MSDLIAVSELELRNGEDVVSERPTRIAAIGSGPSEIEVPVDHLPLVSLRVVEEEIIFAGVDVVVVHPGGAGAEVIVAVQVEMVVPPLCGGRAVSVTGDKIINVSVGQR